MGEMKKCSRVGRRVINFKGTALVLLETCISFGTWPEAFDLVHFPSHVTPHGRRSVVTFLAMNTCLWRNITYRKPSRTLRNHPINSGCISRNHQCVLCYCKSQVRLSFSSKLLTSNTWNVWLTGGGQGWTAPIWLTPSCNITELQVDAEESSSLTCLERVKGRERQCFGNKTVSERTWSSEIAGGVHCVAFHLVTH